MLSEEKINQINYLANKKKKEGLTKEETLQQKALYKEYLTSLRAGLSNHIEGIKIVDAEGNDLTSDKVRSIQKEKGLHDRNI